MKLPCGIEESDSRRFSVGRGGSRWWNHSFLRRFKKNDSTNMYMNIIQAWKPNKGILPVRGMTYGSIDSFKCYFCTNYLLIIAASLLLQQFVTYLIFSLPL
ncbi:unnamed protein product [Lupinus luteus]|uniref:Transmembrane protein n=1 Tax=Lupinus luteus TaxID=3873 RepID=A0AAV1XNW5_LUPLU